MPDVVWYNWCPQTHQPRALRVVRRFAHASGYTFGVLHGCSTLAAERRIYQTVRTAKHVFMWGGHKPGQHLIRRIAKGAGAKCWTIEFGWFPQRQYLSLDVCGIAGDSILCRDLEWIGQAELERYYQFRDRWWNQFGRWIGGGNHVLVPLQLEFDASIVLYSQFQTMQEWVEYASDQNVDRPLLIKTHPLASGAKIYTHHLIRRKGRAIDYARNAHSVFGINSTTLLEAAMMGVPVTACGECPLKYHHNCIDRLLAAYVYLQIDPGRDNLVNKIERLTSISFDHETKVHALSSNQSIPGDSYACE